MTAFYEPGTVSLDDGRSLTVDTPCLVIASPTSNGFRVAVSNPAGDAATVSVQIQEQGNTDRTIVSETVDLPGGQQGGSTVIQRLEP